MKIKILLISLFSVSLYADIVHLFKTDNFRKSSCDELKLYVECAEPKTLVPWPKEDCAENKVKLLCEYDLTEIFNLSKSKNKIILAQFDEQDVINLKLLEYPAVFGQSGPCHEIQLPSNKFICIDDQLSLIDSVAEEQSKLDYIGIKYDFDTSDNFNIITSIERFDSKSKPFILSAYCRLPIQHPIISLFAPFGLYYATIYPDMAQLKLTEIADHIIHNANWDINYGGKRYSCITGFLNLVKNQYLATIERNRSLTILRYTGNNDYVRNSDSIDKVAILELTANVNSVAFNKNYSKLVTVSDDSILRLWQITGSLQNHKNPKNLEQILLIELIKKYYQDNFSSDNFLVNMFSKLSSLVSSIAILDIALKYKDILSHGLNVSPYFGDAYSYLKDIFDSLNEETKQELIKNYSLIV